MIDSNPVYEARELDHEIRSAQAAYKAAGERLCIGDHRQYEADRAIYRSTKAYLNILLARQREASP